MAATRKTRAGKGKREQVELCDDVNMALEEKTPRGADPRFWDIAIRDGGKCLYCGLDGASDMGILRTLQLDHLIPRRAKGSDDPSNLVLCCSRCNGDKGVFDPSSDATDPLTREILVEKAKRFIETQRGVYFTDLHHAINSR